MPLPPVTIVGSPNLPLANSLSGVAGCRTLERSSWAIVLIFVTVSVLAGQPLFAYFQARHSLYHRRTLYTLEEPRPTQNTFAGAWHKAESLEFDHEHGKVCDEQFEQNGGPE